MTDIIYERNLRAMEYLTSANPDKFRFGRTHDGRIMLTAFDRVSKDEIQLTHYIINEPFATPGNRIIREGGLA